MKKIIIGLLMLLGITGVQAQEYEYVPLAREGVKWVYYVTMHKDGRAYFSPLTVEFKGDTTLGLGALPSQYREFKKCYMTIDTEYKDDWQIPVDENGTFLAAMVRDYDNRVFVIYTKDYMNAFVPRATTHPYVTGIATGIFYGLADPNVNVTHVPWDNLNEQWMIYDFNDPSGFIHQACPVFDENNDCFRYLKAEEEEMVTINGSLRKKYAIKFKDTDESYYGLNLIEGIGAVFDTYQTMFSTFISPLGKLHYGGHYTEFSHVEEDGQVVFIGPYYEDFNKPDDINDILVDTSNKGDNNYYNLMGQPVAEPTQPGIYIHHGKKLVIK